MIKVLGGKIKASRKEKGYSQTDLAARAKVTQSNVSKWEKGEQSIEFDKMVRLAKAVERPLHHFADNSELPAREKTMDDLMDIIKRQANEIKALKEETPAVAVPELRVASPTTEYKSEERPDFIPEDIYERFRHLEAKHFNAIRGTMGLPPVKVAASKKSASDKSG